MTDTSDKSHAAPHRPSHVDNYLVGMLFALLAFFLLAAMNMIAKLLSVNHSVLEISFYRNLIAVMPFLFVVFGMGRRDILNVKGDVKLLIFRSVLGTVSLAVTFAAYAAMPMADTTAFLFTTSLIVPALGFFMLGERVSSFRWSAIAAGFIGVLIMVRPAGDVNVLGVTLALSAAFIHAFLQILLRKLGKVESPETVTFYFLLIGMLVTAVPMPFIFTMPTMEQVPLLIAIGLCGALAQLCLSIAYKNAPANVVTIFNYSGIIWATAFGWFIWSDWPTLNVWIGGVLVILSNLVILWREARAGARQPRAVE